MNALVYLASTIFLYCASEINSSILVLIKLIPYKVRNLLKIDVNACLSL
jgi:hypothetical protein